MGPELMVDLNTSALDLATYLVDEGPAPADGDGSEPTPQGHWVRGTLRACLMVAEAAQELIPFLRAEAGDGPRTEGPAGRGKRTAGEPSPQSAAPARRVALVRQAGVLTPTMLNAPASGKAAASAPAKEEASSSSAGTSQTTVAEDDLLGAQPELQGSTGPVQPSARGRKALAKARDSLTDSPAQGIATWKGLASSMFPDAVASHRRQLVATWQQRPKGFEAVHNRLARELSEAPAGSGGRTECESALCDLDEHLRLQLIKQYQRPRAAHWLESLDAQQFEVGPVTALRSDAAASKEGVFEVRLQPRPDGDGRPYPPAWLHVHTSRPMQPSGLLQAKPDDIVAAHLENDRQKALGRKHLQEQRAMGNDDLMIHRGPLSHEQLLSFLERASAPR